MSDSSSSHSIPWVATPSRSMRVISMLLMPPVHTLLQVLASSVRPAEAATAHGSRRAGPTPLGRRAPGHDICRSGLFPRGQPSDVVVELEFVGVGDRKSTRLNSSHVAISYAVFCLKKKKNYTIHQH